MSQLTLEDRAEIQDLLIRYATAIDTRDWDLLRTCFAADCRADYGQYGAFEGVDALCEGMDGMHRAVGQSQHRLSNILITPEDGGARARSYVDVIILAKNGGKPIRAAGGYDDHLVRGDGGWVFKSRKYATIYTEVGG